MFIRLATVIIAKNSIFQIEDKAKASAAWTRIVNAGKVLGVSPQESTSLWSVLAAIYHLGVASVSRGNMVSQAYKSRTLTCWLR